MVGHRSNSEPNLPRAKQFDERADLVAGLPASEIKGAIKRRVWPMCSSDFEARSMAMKRQRVSTRSSDSSVANKKTASFSHYSHRRGCAARRTSMIHRYHRLHFRLNVAYNSMDA